MEDGIGRKSLKNGDKAPYFELQNAKNKMFSYHGKGTLIINFIRGSWCPYCNIEISVWNEVYKEIKSKGAEMVMITPNTSSKVSEMHAKYDLSFEMLSDQGNKVGKQFGLVFTLPAMLRPIYEKFGINISSDNGDESYELPIPATYVVKDGVIVYSFVDPDYTKRAEPREVLKVI